LGFRYCSVWLVENSFILKLKPKKIFESCVYVFMICFNTSKIIFQLIKLTSVTFVAKLFLKLFHRASVFFNCFKRKDVKIAEMKILFIFFLLFVFAYAKKCYVVEEPKCNPGEVYQLKGPGPFCYSTCW